MKNFDLLKILLLLFIPIGCASGTTDLYRVSFEASVATLDVEIANTPGTRQQGLMGRQTLGEDQGMLFVFPQDQILQFWMKNTSLPLSIAYIDSRGIILRIKNLEPFDLSPVSSDVPVRYALEVHRGWFEANGIREGNRIIFSEPRPRAQL
jgi:uncharacterized membrane protein (UPF0127 family)